MVEAASMLAPVCPSTGKRLVRRPMSTDLVERSLTGWRLARVSSTRRRPSAFGTGTVHRVKREMVATAS